jgi:Holliday junction DNA helicase RuvA
MYDYITGTLTHKTATYLIIEAGGIGYQLHVSLQTYTQLKDAHQAKIYTHLAIKEDAHTLYGFAHEDERTLFRHLISVSGVGPGTARVMLSSITSAELQQAIINGQVAAIKRIKGIGDKTAQRIILDLKDKLAKTDTPTTIISTPHNTHKEQALSALLTLGFNRAAADKELTKISSANPAFSVEDLIKEALKNL